MDKKLLSERDICTKFITPAIEQAGWTQSQMREQVNITDGRVMVRGKMAVRVKNTAAKGGSKRADYVLYAKPNLSSVAKCCEAFTDDPQLSRLVV